MLNGITAMQKFVKIVITEPEMNNSPFMLDASKFDIVMAGLNWYQRKGNCEFYKSEGWRRKIKKTDFIIEEAWISSSSNKT